MKPLRWLYWHEPMKGTIIDCVSTPLGALNFLILQWFGLRLVQRRFDPTKRTYPYGILFGVVPLSGWWGRYRGIKLWIPLW